MKDELQKLYALIDDIEIAMMTTRRRDGHLQSRAMATQKPASGADLWFVTADGAGKLADLSFDDHLNLAFYRDGNREWISVSGTAVVSRDRAEDPRAVRSRLEGILPGRGRPQTRHAGRSADGVDRRDRSCRRLPRDQQASTGPAVRVREGLAHRQRSGFRRHAPPRRTASARPLSSTRGGGGGRARRRRSSPIATIQR